MHLFRCRLLSFCFSFTVIVALSVSILLLSEPGNCTAAVIKRRPTHKTKTDDVSLGQAS